MGRQRTAYFINIWLQYQKMSILINLVMKVNEHNNEYHITIKVKPVDAKSSIYIEFVKEINNNYLKFNSMVTMQQYQNTGINSQNLTFLICQTKFIFFLQIEDTSHYLLHCYHFTLYLIDLMISVKRIYNNFESLIDKNKITIYIYTYYIYTISVLYIIYIYI